MFLGSCLDKTKNLTRLHEFFEVWPREPSDNYYHTARSVPVDRSEVPRLTLGSLKCLLYRPRFRREWQ